MSIIILSLPSCVSDLELISEDVYLLKPDKSNPNTKTYEGSLIYLKPTNNYYHTVEMRLGFVKAKNKETWVVKTVYSNYSGWWYIDKVGFCLDNARYCEFNSQPNALRLVNYPADNIYYEENIFILNQKLCCALLKAKQLSITFVNRYDGLLEGYLEKEDLEKLKNFINYIDSRVLSQK